MCLNWNDLYVPNQNQVRQMKAWVSILDCRDRKNGILYFLKKKAEIRLHKIFNG